jgi:hypothetical protein
LDISDPVCCVPFNYAQRARRQLADAPAGLQAPALGRCDSLRAVPALLPSQRTGQSSKSNRDNANCSCHFRFVCGCTWLDERTCRHRRRRLAACVVTRVTTRCSACDLVGWLAVAGFFSKRARPRCPTGLDGAAGTSRATRRRAGTAPQRRECLPCQESRTPFFVP